MQYIGALIGDYCGSIYEWNNSHEESPDNIEILKNGKFTDDSVLTVAVMEWLVNTGGKSSKELAEYLKDWATNYPDAGYGGKFKTWVLSDSDNPINSYGNGAGMRVSPCAFYANTLEECLDLAKKSAEVTHNHEEGIKGAQAIAEAIYLARSGASKPDIKKIIEEDFKYDLNKGLEEIGTKAHRFDATCQVTVPEAIICFLNSQDFMDCIRKSIWIGGDSDTIAAMACSIAEAYYGLPHFIMEQFKEKFPEDMKKTIMIFNEKMLRR
jgi:ADP-ribosylglycohydrolase